MAEAAATARKDRRPGAGDVLVQMSGRNRLGSRAGSDVLAVCLAALVALVAGGALVGWIFGWPQLASWVAGAVQTKVNAAICLLCLGGAVALQASRLNRPALTRAATLLGLFVAAFMGATLFEHATGFNLGIDRLFFADSASAAAPNPGRPALQTTVALLSVAIGVLATGRSVRGRYPTEYLGLVCGVAGGIGLLGYAFGADELVSIGSATHLALPTAVALTLLAIALIASNPDHDLTRFVADPGPAGTMLRVTLPAAFLVVPVGAWFRLWGERAGLYDAELGLSIMVTFEATILVAVGAWSASRIQRLEGERAEARRDIDRFFELTADLVCVAGEDGRLVMASPSWEQVLGYSVAEITSGPFIDFVHPDDRERTMAEFGSELGGRQAYSFQNRYRTADGGYRWLEWNSMPDAASARIYAVARDVTQRKRAEEDLARLAAIVESSADGILAVDAGGRITEWNAGAEALFGYTAAEAIGQDLALTAPDDERSEQLQRWSEAAAGRSQIYETFRQRKDGSRFRALLSLSPVAGREGVQLGVSTIVRDVTEAYEARQRLERSSKELARSNAELEQFAYVASHDLQEPLRMVTGFMGLLQKQYGNTLGDEADEYIGFAVDGARRMQGLIDDLLTYSRVGSRGRNPESVDLGDIAGSVAQNLRPLLEETGATIRQGELPTVPADRLQMIQLYQNLVGNGMKFHGERPPDIELGAERGRGEWRLFVRDHGIGIPPEHRANVFEIFRRLHSREEYPGSGIGLAVCKRIVERHHGRIWIETTAGGGSTFWFTLPDRTRSDLDDQ